MLQQSAENKNIMSEFHVGNFIEDLEAHNTESFMKGIPYPIHCRNEAFSQNRRRIQPDRKRAEPLGDK